MGYHGMLWGSMGITRNVMENIGFFRFSDATAKTNPNESKELQIDVKVTCYGAAEDLPHVPLTFRNASENPSGGNLPDGL